MAEKIPVIVIDAGHGGSDSGAVYKGRKEKDDNLRLGLAVGKKLVSDYVVSVKHTRTTDIFEKPSKKAQDSDDYGADLLMSLHRNSSIPTANGYETLVWSNIGIKKELADKLNKRMAGLGFRNRGTKIRKDLTILSKPDAPAVLLETGFISNEKDNKIFDSKFDEIVNIIVLSIAEVMELEKKKKVQNISEIFKNGDYNNKVRTTSNLNVRAGRGTDYKALGTLPKGTEVTALYILEKDGTPWASIDYGKTVGYISLKYAEPV